MEMTTVELLVLVLVLLLGRAQAGLRIGTWSCQQHEQTSTATAWLLLVRSSLGRGNGCTQVPRDLQCQ